MNLFDRIERGFNRLKAKFLTKEKLLHAFDVITDVADFASDVAVIAKPSVDTIAIQKVIDAINNEKTEELAKEAIEAFERKEKEKEKKKDLDLSNTEYPSEEVIRKNEISCLNYSEAIDTKNGAHGAIIGGYGIKDFNTIANLPEDFKVLHFNEGEAKVSIPASDPTGKLAPEGENHMMKRRLIFITFRGDDMIRVEDAAYDVNTPICWSFIRADKLLVLHCRGIKPDEGKILSRSNLWVK